MHGQERQDTCTPERQNVSGGSAPAAQKAAGSSSDTAQALFGLESYARPQSYIKGLEGDRLSREDLPYMLHAKDKLPIFTTEDYSSFISFYDIGFNPWHDTLKTFAEQLLLHVYKHTEDTLNGDFYSEVEAFCEEVYGEWVEDFKEHGVSIEHFDINELCNELYHEFPEKSEKSLNELFVEAADHMGDQFMNWNNLLNYFTGDYLKFTYYETPHRSRRDEIYEMEKYPVRSLCAAYIYISPMPGYVADYTASYHMDMIEQGEFVPDDFMLSGKTDVKDMHQMHYMFNLLENLINNHES